MSNSALEKVVTTDLLNTFHNGLKSLFSAKETVGELTSLNTANKNNIVAAINELKASLNNNPTYEFATEEDIQSILNGTYVEQ